MLKSNLKNILDERGIKYTHIAKKVKISNTTMSALINNQTTPTFKTAYYIAKELKLKMESIWYFEED